MDKSDLSSSAGNRFFAIVACAFVATLLVSNIAAQKLITLGPFVFTGGILLFPFAYIFGDVLTEVYGYSKTRQVIWCGLLANILLAAFLALVVVLPPAPGWELQSEFSKVFAFVPRVILASVAAYWVGEFANSYVMSKMKLASSGRHLWKRTIASTVIGQSLDSVIFVLIAFTGIVPTSVMITTVWTAIIFKVAYEVLATPLTYLIVSRLKSAEGVDVFDIDQDYNPFSGA